MKLTGFEGNYQSGKIILKWKTEEETNLDHFIVEKSSNGSIFSSITNVKAAGTGSNLYSAIDISPAQGNNFYRLKQTDADGSFSYSKIINIKNSDVLSPQIYPNPVSKNININAFLFANSIIEIKDLTGRIILVHKIKNPVTSISLDVSFLSAGAYILITREETKTSRRNLSKISSSK